MSRGMGNSASGKSCNCEIKNKENWKIIGYIKYRGLKTGYIINCNKCFNQWNTKAKYCENLEKASYLK